MSEALGALLIVVLIVGVAFAALGGIAYFFGIGIGRRRDAGTPPRPSRTHSWSVRLPDGEHRVEVRDDLAHPLVAYCDGVAIALDWQGTYATFAIDGHAARLVPRIDWAAAFLPFGGRALPAFALVVVGAAVEPASSP